VARREAGEAVGLQVVGAMRRAEPGIREEKEEPQGPAVTAKQGAQERAAQWQRVAVRRADSVVPPRR
jgi:hypothetical protein